MTRAKEMREMVIQLDPDKIEKAASESALEPES